MSRFRNIFSFITFCSKAAEEKKRREAKDKRDKEESSKVNEKINFGFLFLF